jgi:hypothetical protein
MSQQEIDRDGSGTSYAGYEGVPHYGGYSANSYGEKLSGQEANRVPTAGQRLALAIVSLSLWMALFLIVVIGAAVTSPFNPISRLLYPLLILGLLIFTALVFVINVLFNRKH